MRSRLMVWSLVTAAALMVTGLPPAQAAAPQSAQSQPAGGVSLGYFMDRLSLFGRWLNHPKWGAVWQPDAGPKFRPYFYGYWQDTADDGWFWVSNEPYGDVVYHYGRWVFDPAEGWLWVPGYVWGPSWVVWREGEGAVGWLPMPPGYADFDAGVGITPQAANGSYGYQAWYGRNFASNGYFDLWTFVPVEDFARSNRRHYVTDRQRLRDFLMRSQDRTAYRIDDDRIVDRSLAGGDVQRERSQGSRVDSASRFMRRGVPVTTVSQAQEIFQSEREGRAQSRTLPEATPQNAPAQDSAAARRALATLPSHGATPLRPLYPGLGSTLPLADSLRAVQRRSRTIGSQPLGLGQGNPDVQSRPGFGPTPLVTQPLRDIDRQSRSMGTYRLNQDIPNTLPPPRLELPPQNGFVPGADDRPGAYSGYIPCTDDFVNRTGVPLAPSYYGIPAAAAMSQALGSALSAPPPPEMPRPAAP